VSKWECKGCPDPNMFMELNSWDCRCPENMMKQGDSCILNEDFDLYVSNADIEQGLAKMTYKDVETAR
jgi:hypothetical protein